MSFSYVCGTLRRNRIKFKKWIGLFNLKVRITESCGKRWRGSLRGREESSIHWFPPQMIATARARPGWSQEPEPSSGSPVCVIGFHTLGLSSTVFPGHLKGDRYGMLASQVAVLPTMSQFWLLTESLFKTYETNQFSWIRAGWIW